MDEEFQAEFSNVGDHEAGGSAHTDELGEIQERSLLKAELDDLSEREEVPASVTYSTQDFPVDALVKRLENGGVLVPQFGGADERVKTAGFQRGFVWTKAQMDRFIESLLLGYPIPGIFLVRQPDKRMLVLDGQQRLETLRRFYEGVHEKREFSLYNVGLSLKGVTYKTLDEDQQRQLDDSYIQATIVTADGSDAVNEAIYQIFERLNSGGTQLTAHEIRVALYAGEFIDAIEHLNSDDNWRSLFGRRSKRIRDHELVCRILAFYESGSSYSSPLKSFLNDYVNQNRHRKVDMDQAGEYFRQATAALKAQVGYRSLRSSDGSQVNAAQSEAVMVAIMHAAAAGSIPTDLRGRMDLLLENETFREATGWSTGHADMVEARLQLAREVLVG